MIQTLTLTINFNLEGADPADLRAAADAAIHHAMGCGAFTAGTDAEVDAWGITVKQEQGFDEIADHLDTLTTAGALFWFMENVNDDHPARSELFFYCRNRVINDDLGG